MPQPEPTARSDKSRQRILDTFVDLLLEQAYERITITALLARAAVGRATFYAHFDSKEALLDSSVQRLGAGLADRAQAHAVPLAFVGDYLQHVGSHRAIYQSFAGRPSFELLERCQRRMLTTLVRDDLARHRCGSTEQQAVAVPFIVGAVWGVVSAWLERRLLLAEDDLVRLVDRLLRQGPLATASNGQGQHQAQPGAALR
jgi:AcrR family transcriptional regulator